MNRPLKRSAARQNGFSLLELLIAMVVLAMATTAGYEALRAGLFKLDRLGSAAQQNGEAAIALAEMSRDLRSATLLGEKTIFSGHGNALEFSRMTENGPEPLHITAAVFRYFDGNQWLDQWNWDDEHNRPLTGTRGLPQAVQVRLRLDGQESTATIPIMVARLNAAS